MHLLLLKNISVSQISLSFFSFKEKNIYFFTDHKPAYSIITFRNKQACESMNIFLTFTVIHSTLPCLCIQINIRHNVGFSPVVCSSFNRSFACQIVFIKVQSSWNFLFSAVIPSPCFFLCLFIIFLLFPSLSYHRYKNRQSP